MNRVLLLALIALPGLIGTSAEAAVRTISLTAKGKIISSTSECMLSENGKIVPFCGKDSPLPAGTPWTFTINLSGNYEGEFDSSDVYWTVLDMEGIILETYQPDITMSVNNGKINYIEFFTIHDCCTSSYFSVIQNRFYYHNSVFDLALVKNWDDDYEYSSGWSEEYGAGHLTSLYIDGVRTGYVPEPSSWAMMLAGFGLVGGLLRRKAKPGPAAMRMR